MSEQLYVRSSDVLFAELGDDVVALHAERGQCYGMENVTAAIWNILAEPIDTDGICRQLVGMYEVEPEICRSEVTALIAQLRSEGLIREA